MPGWLTEMNDKGEVHTTPIDDLIAHEEEECNCDPAVEYIALDSGGFGIQFIHNAIDGRE